MIKQITAFGTTYKSISKLAEDWDVNYMHLLKCMKKYGRSSSIEEIIENLINGKYEFKELPWLKNKDYSLENKISMQELLDAFDDLINNISLRICSTYRDYLIADCEDDIKHEIITFLLNNYEKYEKSSAMCYKRTNIKSKRYLFKRYTWLNEYKIIQPYLRVDVSRRDLEAALSTEDTESYRGKLVNTAFGFCDTSSNNYTETHTNIAEHNILRKDIYSQLDTLLSMEKDIIELRFGLRNNKPKTLEEVGSIYGKTRESIRQIEAKALRKLRHPSRSNKLKGWIDDSIDEKIIYEDISEEEYEETDYNYEEDI